jgi:HAD superfamily hydrolase (TIGR01549 family)
MPFKAVLFDMFDTLVLINRDYEFYNHAVTRMHKYLTEQGVNMALEPFHEAYVKARDELYAKAEENLEEPHFNVRIQNALQMLGHNYEASNPIVAGATWEFCQEFFNNVRIDDNAKTVLQTLHSSNYKLGVVSNFAIPEGVHYLLQNNQITSLFETIIVSGEVNRRKPHPDIFKTALEKMGLNSSETVFVGDTADADVGGAHGVGMKAVYIKRRLEQTLEKYTPDVIIESLSELPDAIKKF